MDVHTNPSRKGSAQKAIPARRRFLKTLTAATGSLLTLAALPRPPRAHPAGSSHLHLQDCRVAGSHYYDCRTVLAHLHPGHRLSLRRQSDNPYDAHAIEVFWRKHKLGYLPRLDNAATASLADHGHTLHARILATEAPEDAWEPVQLRVWVTTTPRRNRHGI